MRLRKLIDMKGVYAVTIPRVIIEAVGFKRGDYVELYLRDRKTIVLKRHGTEPKRITVIDN